jgi:hypothetical protein
MYEEIRLDIGLYSAERGKWWTHNGFLPFSSYFGAILCQALLDQVIGRLESFQSARMHSWWGCSSPQYAPCCPRSIPWSAQEQRATITHN